MLTRDQILNAPDLQREVVPVPEWGGEVIVRGLTGEERDAFEAAMVEFKGRQRQVRIENVRARLAAYTIVGEDGERLFSERDIVALGRKSAAALQRVFDAARRLSAMTEADVEELEKN